MSVFDHHSARRELLRWMASSPFVVPAAAGSLLSSRQLWAFDTPDTALNVLQFEELARRTLDREVYDFIAGGADDEKTLRANREAFDRVQILARRLVDVSEVDTSIELLGERMETPILLAPVGAQGAMHPQGELATARSAASRRNTMMVSTVSTYSVAEIARASSQPIWFQLYTTPDRSMTKDLLRQAEEAGCSICALTVDTPVLGNRENQKTFFSRLLERGEIRLGNFDELGLPPGITDPSLSWDFIGWLKANTSMKILIKGIVTAEDAKLCVQNGADGLVISNHGGRQLESGLATLDSLPEVVEAVGGRIPVLIDGGINRGTDIFKALALGADAICIGRAYLWGLATFGQGGVDQVLDLLRAELVRDMQIAGTPSVRDIRRESVRFR